MMTRVEYSAVEAFCSMLRQHVAAKAAAGRGEDWPGAVAELLDAARAGVDTAEARKHRALAPCPESEISIMIGGQR